MTNKTDIEDVLSNIRWHLEEAQSQFDNGGQELSASQLTKLWLDASRLTKALHEAKLAAQGQEWGE